jgi:hypothetical protein
VATFAHGLAIVDGCGRARRGSKAGTHVACRALGGHRYIGVERARVPAGVATLVATVAVGNGYTAK